MLFIFEQRKQTHPEEALSHSLENRQIAEPEGVLSFTL